MHYTLKHLRYLVEIAETENITQAAVNLGVAQPSLTAAIDSLENQFDTQLLIRYKAKGVVVTPAGQKFISKARQLLLYDDELCKSMQGFAKDMTGEITLGCYTTIAPFFIPNLLRLTNQQFPALTIQSLEKNLDELQDDLFNGRYELALLYNINLDDNIATKTLKKCKPYIIVANDHPLANRKRVALKELQDEPYIMHDLPNSRDYFKRIFSNNHVEPNIQYHTSGFEMVRCLVAQQRGYSILNLQPANNATYDNGSISCIEIAGRQEPLDIVLAHVKDLQLTQRAEHFSEFCISYFQDNR